MNRLKPPPKYANVPAVILFDPGLPDPIFRSLIQIVALAWQTKGERTPPATVLELATLRGLKERRMYDHLRELKDRHLIQVENLGDGRIVIRPLRWADDASTALPVSVLTPTDLALLEHPTAKNCSLAQNLDDNPSTAKDCSSTAIGDNTVVVVDLDVPEKQQQHNPATATNCSATAKSCSDVTAKSCTLLTDFGIGEQTAQELAATCSQEQIEAWIAYARQAPNLTNKPGFVIDGLRSGQPPPKKRDDSKRYIQGKYARFIEH